MKGVRITYTHDFVITTDVNPNVSDDDIRKYFKVGEIVNVGNGENDRFERIISVKILN